MENLARNQGFWIGRKTNAVERRAYHEGDEVVEEDQRRDGWAVLPMPVNRDMRVNIGAT